MILTHFDEAALIILGEGFDVGDDDVMHFLVVADHARIPVAFQN